jgi:hypothetical protein
MTLEDIQRDEPLLYNSLNYILTAPEAELEDYPLTINGVVHVPTLENRVVLVNLKINSLIPQEADSRMNDVVFGFNRVLPIRLASERFGAAEVRLIIEGNPYIDVSDMIRAFRRNSPVYQPSRWIPSIFSSWLSGSSYEVTEWLYNILRSLSQEELHLFLRFVTGDSQAPVDGFSQSPLKVSVHDQRNRLPRAATCFSTLYLSRYTNENELRRRLMLAITESIGLEDWHPQLVSI